MREIRVISNSSGPESAMKRAIEDLGDLAEAAAGIEEFQILAMRVDAERKELTRKYPDQWIAMSKDGIVASADTVNDLFKQVDETGFQKEVVFHAYMNTKPQKWIL